MELTPSALVRRLPALLAAAVLLAGCTEEPSGRPRPEREASDVPQVTVTGDPCDDAGRYQSVCGSVDVGGRPYRYALIEGSRPAGSLTLMDPGGPGTSLFGSGWPQEAVTRLAATDVLVIEEPWVLAKLPDTCRKALGDWYRELRAYPSAAAASRGAATKIGDSCRLWTGRWGWQPDQYRSVLSAILEKERREPSAFVGFSFGSARLAYAAELNLHLEDVKLLSPFPAGASAATWLRARNSKLAAGPEFSSDIVGERPAERSLPVTRSDIEAAALQAQYVDQATRNELGRHGGDARVVGHMSDMLFGRYGVSDLSPSILAYWDETCPALKEWDRSGPRSFLAAFNQVCTGSTPAQWEALDRLDARPCVVGVVKDGVVPLEVLAPWVRSHRWDLVTAHGRHADAHLLTRCSE